MLPSAAVTASRSPALYHGLFRRDAGPDGDPRVVREETSASTVPCPNTGRQLRVATVDVDTAAICPSCERHGNGGFISFVGDLRMAYACPLCCQLVWLAGA